jgi:hypothetical protein
VPLGFNQLLAIRQPRKCQRQKYVAGHLKKYIMYKKSVLFILFLTIGSMLICGQENESILTAPENWQHEIIPFPLNFAPAIDFTGLEDLRFSPGWSDSTSQEFWTYCFAWYIDMDSAMTGSKLTESFTIYYDGLMGVNQNNQADSTISTPMDKTVCSFVKTNEGFNGRMNVYDAFFTNDNITLNIKVTESFCAEMNKQIILCYISPKAFDHKVWNIFDEVRLKVKCE